MTATRIDLSPLSIDTTDVTEFAAVNDLPSMSVTISGYWDTHHPPPIRRAAPIVLKLRPGKAFRAHSQLVTVFSDDGAHTTVELSPADDARLHKYLHPEVYARRSAMHSAYRRRHASTSRRWACCWSGDDDLRPRRPLQRHPPAWTAGGLMIRVTLEDTETGKKETVELPSGDYAVVACRWSDAVDAIAGRFGSEVGMLRIRKAELWADWAVEALAAGPLLLPRRS